MNMKDATETLVPCPVCRNSTEYRGEKLWASDECKTTYPGIHVGGCKRCGFKTELRCIGTHEPRDFLLSREEAIREDHRRKEAKEQR